MATNETGRKVDINLRLSEFEIPPMQKVLVVGKRAPIGMEAARRMANVVSPEQYVIIPVKDKVIEALVVKKSVLKMVPQNVLIPIVLEEAKKMMLDDSVIKIDLDISISVKKTIELGRTEK